MICLRCGNPISVRQSVTWTDEGWQHSACGGVTNVQPATDPSPPQDVLDEIAATVERMLNVPRIGGETDAHWRRGRGLNIAHRLGLVYRIERRLGAVPEAEVAGDTEPLGAIHAKGG